MVLANIYFHVSDNKTADRCGGRLKGRVETRGHASTFKRVVSSKHVISNEVVYLFVTMRRELLREMRLLYTATILAPDSSHVLGADNEVRIRRSLSRAEETDKYVAKRQGRKPEIDSIPPDRAEDR